MRISMLGALAVRGEDGNGVGVGGTRLRALLILLALEPGRVVASESLVDGIWQDEPPTGAAKALQALVSRLRRTLRGTAANGWPARAAGPWPGTRTPPRGCCGRRWNCGADPPCWTSPPPTSSVRR
ncbi:helix-turn-helix domain-containing protein [Streptomyces sp. NPDC048424]|uniref:AfsR/SARP family transcriptional regulator n=1 Tax=Streptomyces sp. NPDC048424 TaxID=3155265 RepID=UPI0034379F58